jgi:RNA polymerase sigma factor (TIGR02999 family)
MDASSQATVTRMLQQLEGGDRSVVDALFPLVYGELRALAHRHRQHWHGDYTLNTTGLVHEAYLKLVDHAHAPWDNRAHFLGVASKAMRQILMDYARRRRAQKRGGDVLKLSLDDVQPGAGGVVAFSEEQAALLLALEEALKKLEQVNERAARVIESRVFGGMTVAETATALGISVATVMRDWTTAQAWLHRALSEAG